MLFSKIKTVKRAINSVFRTEREVKELRRALPRMIRPVLLNDIKRVKPITNDFGFSRGIPIDRYYIEKFLQNHKDAIKGNLLEVSGDDYIRKYGQEGSTCSILQFTENKAAENKNILSTGGGGERSFVYADLTRLDSFEHDAFDCFVCTQTFNFIYDIKRAIEGAYAILREGGTLLATVSGISQISRYDMDRWGDYWRLTDLSAKKMFGEVFGQSNVSVEIFGNALASVLLLQGLSQEDLEDESILDQTDNDYQVTLGIAAKKQ